MWNAGEKSIFRMGKKKRIINQFNEYILGNMGNPFKINTITNEEICATKLNIL